MQTPLPREIVMNTTATMHYDAIIVGSGAGGSAAAYRLAHGGWKVLLLEKGPVLPRDGSTLDVDKVIRQGLFKSKEIWLDKDGNTLAPEEYFNLGGKTKWYGAELLRFSPHEFEADPAHRIRNWITTPAGCRKPWRNTGRWCVISAARCCERVCPP